MGARGRRTSSRPSLSGLCLHALDDGFLCDQCARVGQGEVVEGTKMADLVAPVLEAVTVSRARRKGAGDQSEARGLSFRKSDPEGRTTATSCGLPRIQHGYGGTGRDVDTLAFMSLPWPSHRLDQRSGGLELVDADHAGSADGAPGTVGIRVCPGALEHGVAFQSCTRRYHAPHGFSHRAPSFPRYRFTSVSGVTSGAPRLPRTWWRRFLFVLLPNLGGSCS